jgi:hypothetical protein
MKIKLTSILYALCFTAGTLRLNSADFIITIPDDQVAAMQALIDRKAFRIDRSPAMRNMSFTNVLQFIQAFASHHATNSVKLVVRQESKEYADKIEQLPPDKAEIIRDAIDAEIVKLP